MQSPNEIIGAAEAAEILGENVRSVQRKAKAGEYPAQKLDGTRGAYVFNRAEVEALTGRAS